MKKTLKERLVEVSLQLFEEHGYNHVTVNDIVQAAGSSKGGFYHYFTSKDQLLYEIHDVFITYVIRDSERICEEYDTPVARLVQMLVSFTKVFDMYQPHIRVFYQESQSLPERYHPEMKAKRRRYREILEEVIREGQETGDFRKELPVTIVALSITGMVNWTHKWFDKKGKLAMEDITSIFVDMILRSIVTEKGKVEATPYYL